MGCRGGVNINTETVVARIREEIDRRWPWLKCQVDRPLGGGAITAAACRRTTPESYLEGHIEKAERRVKVSGRGRLRSPTHL